MTRIPHGTGIVVQPHRVIFAAARLARLEVESILNTLVVIPTLVLVAGCASGNSHVGSHFDCRAPGGTCAPMTVIDARAVAGLGHAQPVSAGLPAPPQTGGRTVPIAKVATSAPPQRSSERVMRIVFPAHIDADGVYRDESTAHAVVEGGEWVDALSGPAAMQTAVPTQGATAIMPVPEKSALATLDEVIASRAARPGPLVARATPPAPVAPPVLRGTPSRSMLPQSLAEVAAGLSAPSVTTLEREALSASYDKPDVAAVQMPEPAAGGAINPGSATAAPKAVVAARTDVVASARFGTVRWKGKLYQLPIAGPQPQRASVELSPGSTSTAALNRAELEKARSGIGFGAPASTGISRGVQVAPSMQAKP